MPEPTNSPTAATTGEQPSLPGPAGPPAVSDQARRFVPARPTGLHRLGKALRARPDLGQLGVALLVGLLGFAAAVQVRADDQDLLPRARRADLFQILDGLTARADQLDQQIAQLEQDKRELIAGAGTEQAAVEQTAALARQLAVLAGTAEATGPGIILTIDDQDGAVDARTMYSAVQELRSAGAEAIELAGAGDAAARVVASTYLVDAAGGIEVDGVLLEPPYRFTAIGDRRTLAEAMEFPQGVVDAVSEDGGTASVSQHGELRIDAVSEPEPPEYASPAPAQEGG